MLRQKRSLSLWLCVALVLGNVIGSGAYVLPGLTAKYGSINILGWVLAAVSAVSVAYMLSRLSVLFPGVGGPYAYVHKAFPAYVAGLVAWSYWIATWSGNAGVAMIFIDYVSNIFPLMIKYKILYAVVIIWIFTLVNSFTIYFSGVLQLWLMIMKIIPLILIMVCSAWYIDWQNFMPIHNQDYSMYTIISKTYILVWWSFIGLESATVPAEYVQKPRINIPKATLFGTVSVGILYVLLNFISIGTLSINKLAFNTTSLFDIAKIIWGDWGVYLVLFGVSTACLGVINGFTILQGQIPHGAAKDGLFPAIMGKVNYYAVPIMPMYLGTFLATLLLLLSYVLNTKIDIFEFVASISIFTTMVAYIFCAFVEYLYKKRHNQEASAGLLLLSIFVFIATLLVVVLMDWQAVLAGLGLLLLSLPLVWYMEMKH